MVTHLERRVRKVMLAFLVCLVAVAAAPASTSAQASANAELEPVFGVSVGFANVLGWLGGGIEVYGLGGRASAILGVGYLPGIDAGAPGFVAYGAAVRRYFGSGRHRLALEASVSLLSASWLSQGGILLEQDKFYGPGLGGAYRYTAARGLHFEAGLGAGWAVSADRFGATGGLVAGYTWRR